MTHMRKYRKFKRSFKKRSFKKGRKRRGSRRLRIKTVPRGGLRL